MSWFTRMCRDLGLAIHHVVKPRQRVRHEVRRTTEQRRVEPSVTLRRTTIEEIEVHDRDRDRDRA